MKIKQLWLGVTEAVAVLGRSLPHVVYWVHNSVGTLILSKLRTHIRGARKSDSSHCRPYSVPIL